MNATPQFTFSTLLQQFFVGRLIQQRHASTRTVEAYRDSFRLLFAFAEQRLKKHPADLKLENLNASFILQFLDHLENDRHNSIRTRNARFAAIRSFMRYVGSKEPSAAALAQSVLCIPLKCFERRLVGFLSREEVQAILEAPSPQTWTGQRDRVMLATLYNTGVRIAELIALRVGDVAFEGGPAIHIVGKGRKRRQVPLWPGTAKQLKRWLRKYPRDSQQPLFPNRSGTPFTRVGVTDRLKLAAHSAEKQCPELAKRCVSPHLLRHSIATHLLQSGVGINVIALFLGHENPTTTHMYIAADLKMKEHALKMLQPPKNTPVRYRPTDRVLQFLEGL
jgi:site-specific recombinase XerD